MSRFKIKCIDVLVINIQKSGLGIGANWPSERHSRVAHRYNEKYMRKYKIKDMTVTCH